MKAIVTAMDEEKQAAFNRLQNDLIWGSHSQLLQAINMCCCARVEISTVMSVLLAVGALINQSAVIHVSQDTHLLSLFKTSTVC